MQIKIEKLPKITEKSPITERFFNLQFTIYNVQRAIGVWC